jgi:hypothetical protein
VLGKCRRHWLLLAHALRMERGFLRAGLAKDAEAAFNPREKAAATRVGYMARRMHGTSLD